MFVADIYAIFLFLGQIVLAPAGAFKGEFSKAKGQGAKILRSDGWGTAPLFVLTCCLTIVMSGCGAGSIDPAGGSLLVSPNAVNFGSVPVGQEADTSVSIANSTSSSVAISQVNVSGQTFSLPGNNSMPISIPAGG